ncbi:MAG: hypothetical protein GY749_20505 [Desulfobacteraceae bacterium]|nr:hypothetical protein [Desulfobacteraceae bacterium]
MKYFIISVMVLLTVDVCYGQNIFTDSHNPPIFSITLPNDYKLAYSQNTGHGSGENESVGKQSMYTSSRRRGSVHFLSETYIQKNSPNFTKFYDIQLACEQRYDNLKKQYGIASLPEFKGNSCEITSGTAGSRMWWRVMVSKDKKSIMKIAVEESGGLSYKEIKSILAGIAEIGLSQ